MSKFVIIGSNNSGKIAVFGNTTGKPFLAEQTALKRIKVLQAQMPSVHFMAVPIHKTESNNGRS